MVGKCFKGLTDELLRWQTKELLERETGRQGIAVLVRPELVVEIALDGVQSSPPSVPGAYATYCFELYGVKMHPILYGLPSGAFVGLPVFGFV